jgi:hypothetical protein
LNNNATPKAAAAARAPIIVTFKAPEKAGMPVILLLTSSFSHKKRFKINRTLANTDLLILIWVSRLGLFRFAQCIYARKKINQGL